MSGARLPLLTVILLALPALALGDAPTGIEFTPLDNFEDCSAWLKGDPKTDLEQKDTAVAASTELVKEGKTSLAFMNRINWTPRPGEKYEKGWPMISRKFPQPQDWSGYDYVYFWLYTKTNRKFVPSPALKIGFTGPDAKGEVEWYSIPGIEPGRWQEIAVPLTMQTDWKRVTGIRLYIAEAWYDDKDQVDFYLDDMRLAKRTIPVFTSCAVSSRTFPRGQAVGVRVRIGGPFAGAALRLKVTDVKGNEQLTSTGKIGAKEQEFTFPVKGLAPGGHYGVAELLSADGKVVDTQKKYFRSLEPGKRCYLKLITFYTKPLGEFDPKALGILNDSAYAGVAIPIQGSYNADPVPDIKAIEPQVKAAREALKIDPWPWVALNRFIGAPTDRQGHAESRATNLGYFKSIKALDLDNETGAREDMMKQWRLAVRVAREWKSPGIMWDPEAYNDYRTYQVPNVAKARGETIDQVIEKCEKVGADFARIIAEEYPECAVWSLFSRFEHSDAVPGRKDRIFTTPTYIALGMLRYAKEKNVPLKFLCGGETMPGYCNKSVEDLKRKIAERDDAVAPILEEFPDHLFLAGTISPFHDYDICTAWIQKGYKGTPFKKLQDFEPLFKTLFDAYDWVWIYASSAARTEPYKPENNKMYSEVLRAALEASVRGE